MRPAIAGILCALILGGWGGPAPAAAAQEQGTAEVGEAAAPDFEGLPEGPGREAVFFACTACHSLRQFTQQRMSREDWDATIERMVRVNKMQAPKPWARTLMLSYLATHFGVDIEDWGGLPPGEGREEVYYTCQACHSLALVRQQRLARDTWNDVLDWMIEEQGMPEPEPQDYRRILNYLATRLSPKTPR